MGAAPLGMLVKVAALVTMGLVGYVCPIFLIVILVTAYHKHIAIWIQSPKFLFFPKTEDERYAEEAKKFMAQEQAPPQP